MFPALIIAITVIMAAWIIARGYKPRDMRPMGHRGLFHVLPVQIICGNCSGTGVASKKTYLAASGKCAFCGGGSYILAANRAVYAQPFTPARQSAP